MNQHPRPLTILVAALGGQGGGVLAEWLVELATGAGHPAQSTSIPGVAQRTGATTYYVEIFPVPERELGGHRPVLSLLPVPGCIDVLVCSELLEAGRMVQNGMASDDRTLVVTSASRTLTTAEKILPGDGRFDAERLWAVVRKNSRRLVAFDMDQATRDAGTAMSAVMFGAIAASGALPFPRDAFEAVIQASGLGVRASRAGFTAGWQAIIGEGKPVPPLASVDASAAAAPVPPAVATALPQATHDFAAEGYRRLVEFQDSAYAERYVQRLARISASETAGDPRHVHGHRLTRETARFLALWMAFDDVVRVADRKCRASRFARVRREVAASEDDIVHIIDYFKPGVAEFAGLLPAALARRLVAWDRRRVARGRDPFALAMTVRSDGVTGFVALRALSSLRWLRRHGARFADEQALIERWLQAIATAAHDDWRCGYEIALCGRLIKGYGATSERGKRNLDAILDHLVPMPFATAADRAQAIGEAREAALADEGGARLDAALVRHGAPPRLPIAQPIRWVKRSPRAAAARTG
jgi:indolepyruvate ferredoxin oxidoreductase beta subunit